MQIYYYFQLWGLSGKPRVNISDVKSERIFPTWIIVFYELGLGWLDISPEANNHDKVFEMMRSKVNKLKKLLTKQ